MKNLKPILWIAAVALLVVAFKTFSIQERLREALAWIESLGAWGPVAFIVMYILACVLFIPGSLLTLGAGLLFGVALGSVYVSIASTVGATACFIIGRYFARDWVAAKIAGNKKFAAVDEAVGSEGWKIVLLTRLSPAFPFNLLNYAYGLTKVRLKDYVLASWVGMMPGTVMYVYLGSLAGSLATLGTEGAERTPVQWTLYGVGLVATVAVTVYVTKVAKRALAVRVV